MPMKFAIAVFCEVVYAAGMFYLFLDLLVSQFLSMNRYVSDPPHKGYFFLDKIQVVRPYNVK